MMSARALQADDDYHFCLYLRFFSSFFYDYHVYDRGLLSDYAVSTASVLYDYFFFSLLSGVVMMAAVFVLSPP